MAVGSNSLGLLFKIGVDTGDAAKQIQDMISQLSPAQLRAASAQLAQAITQLNTALKQSKDLTAEQQAEYQSLIQTLKQYKTQIDETAKALERNTTSSKAFHTELNQVKNGLTNIVQGNFGSAIGQIGSAMATASASGNALIIALVAVAVAAFAAIEAFKGMSKAVEDIGTKSKDDFQQLQSDLKAVNFQLTLADHALSQEVLQSFKNVASAVTAFMAVLLREAGPALIVLLKDIGELLIKILPIAVQLGHAISEGFIQAIAAAQALLVWAASHDLSLTWKVYRQAVQSAREEVEKTRLALQGKTGLFGPSGTETAKVEDDPVIKLAQQRKELADAVAKAEKQTFDDTTLEIQRQLQAREISFKEATEQQQAAADRYREALQNQVSATRLFNDIIFQAEEKRKQTALERQIADQEDVNRRNDNQRKVTDSERKTNADLAKIEEDRLAHTKKVADEEAKIIEEVIREQARAAQGVPGGGGAIPGLPDPAETQRQLDAAHNAIKRALGDFTSLLAENNRQIQENIRNAIQLGGAWGGLVGTLKELFSLKNIGDQFVNTLNSMLDVFIQTGHTGPAVLRQMVAGVLRAIAEQAAAWGAYFLLLAIGFAALGDWADAAKFAVAGLGLEVLAAGLGFAASKIAPSQSTAAAAGGGFGGGADQPPGTVTINQGATSALGIQLGILSALQNITTAPPGDILQRGADQNPMAVGQANNEAARRDGSVSREFLQISGLRTA